MAPEVVPDVAHEARSSQGRTHDDATEHTEDDRSSCAGVTPAPEASERWTRVTHDPAVFGGAPDVGLHELTAVAVGPSTIVAVGRQSDVADSHLGAVWTSPDGNTWQRVAHDPQVLAGEGWQWMRDVTVGGPVFVAVGLDWGREVAALWLSSNC